MHKAKNPTHIIQCLPRMSWSPANLYNLYQRTYGPPTAETKFTKSALTMFQQKWKAKRMVRAYHGDWIPEGKFKKEYLPESLSPIIGSSNSKSTEKVPLASMMFAEVEKRLDTVVFRCCFADSAYKARQMVLHGKVRLNGKKVSARRCPLLCLPEEEKRSSASRVQRGKGTDKANLDGCRTAL